MKNDSGAGGRIAGKALPAAAFADPSLPSAPVRIRLGTAAEVADEAARIYRLARSGRLPLSDATRLMYLLQVLGRLRESAQVGELEARVAVLEESELWG